MQIKVSARHGHLSDEHTAEITARAEKLLHFFERITMIAVIVDLADTDTKHQKKVEIQVDCEHKHDFVAHAAADDVLVAVGVAVDKLKHQIKAYKERVQDHRRDPSAGGGDRG